VHGIRLAATEFVIVTVVVVVVVVVVIIIIFFCSPIRLYYKVIKMIIKLTDKDDY